MQDLRERLQESLADRYLLERALGRGGMATVYLARDLKHDRSVALKVLHPELAATLGPERFQREIRTTARLQHPHILPVLDSGQAAGQLWYTMPFVDGESLRDRLARERQLPLNDALQITCEVADALGYAHSQGVVHRDIKPENIMLAPGHALVADFGVARALQTTGGDQLTEAGMSIGTPAYMSPEQSFADPTLDGRSDLYSLGCVLYEMLAGEAPYTGTSAQAIVAKRLREPVPHIRTIRETVSPAVDKALERALAKIPADRFATAGDFIAALRTSYDTPTLTPAASSVDTVKAGTPSRVYFAIAAIALAAVLATVLLLRQGRGNAVGPDPNVVAVAPFDVLSPRLALWHEGMVDLLSRDLDGAGALRAIAPTTVVQSWKGRADRESSAALARKTGAGVIVYGALTSVGPDSVRLRVSMLDMSRDDVVGEHEIQGAADRIDQLADSLAVAMLRDLGRSRPVNAARLGGIGSRSLPALKAFLNGERLFRRGQWDSAGSEYEQALEHDRNYALALRRLSMVRGWRYGVNDSLSGAYALQAGRLNRGLAPRESLLVVADSLMASLEEGATPNVEGVARIRRLHETTLSATSRYPTDPESWFALGEARFHFGSGWGVSEQMRLEPFKTSIALDSTFAPAYLHTVGLAYVQGDTAAARRSARRFLSLQPAEEGAQPVRLISELLDLGEGSTALRSVLDSQSGSALVNTWIAVADAADSAEIALALARRFVDRVVPDDLWFGDPSVRQELLGNTQAYRGRFREAAATLGALEFFLDESNMVDLALAGAVPADSVDRMYRRRLDREPFWPIGGLHLAPTWWVARGDSVALKRYLERLDWSSRSKTPPPSATTNPYWLEAGKAYLALIRGDSATALRSFVGLPRAVGMVWPEQLAAVRLMIEQGRHREAFTILDRGFPYPYPTPSRVTWALEHARVAEKLAEHEKARRSYGYVAAVWRHADAELQPYVKEARAGLDRLREEGQPDAAK